MDHFPEPKNTHVAEMIAKFGGNEAMRRLKAMELVRKLQSTNDAVKRDKLLKEIGELIGK